MLRFLDWLNRLFDSPPPKRPWSPYRLDDEDRRSMRLFHMDPSNKEHVTEYLRAKVGHYYEHQIKE